MSSNGATMKGAALNGATGNVLLQEKIEPQEEPKFPDVPRYAESTYSFPLNQPVVALDAETAFKGLSEREQLYAHHISRASFVGGLIVLLQTSVESPQIYPGNHPEDLNNPLTG